MSSIANTKQRQVAHLTSQLGDLQTKLETLDQLVSVTAEQASYIRLLGGQQAAWFMAAGRVLTSDGDEYLSRNGPSSNKPEERKGSSSDSS